MRRSNLNHEFNPTEFLYYEELLKEMEDSLPMLTCERTALRQWVGCGNNPERNPWDYYDESGYPLSYLEAYRRHKGYKIYYSFYYIDYEE